MSEEKPTIILVRTIEAKIYGIRQCLGTLLNLIVADSEKLNFAVGLQDTSGHTG